MTCMTDYSKYDTNERTRVPYSQYFRQLDLVPMYMIRADKVEESVKQMLLIDERMKEHSEGVLTFRESDQQFLLDGAIETGYFYDEGHVWRKARLRKTV